MSKQHASGSSRHVNPIGKGSHKMKKKKTLVYIPNLKHFLHSGTYNTPQHYHHTKTKAE